MSEDVIQRRRGGPVSVTMVTQSSFSKASRKELPSWSRFVSVMFFALVLGLMMFASIQAVRGRRYDKTAEAAAIRNLNGRDAENGGLRVQQKELHSSASEFIARDASFSDGEIDHDPERRDPRSRGEAFETKTEFDDTEQSRGVLETVDRGSLSNDSNQPLRLWDDDDSEKESFPPELSEPRSGVAQNGAWSMDDRNDIHLRLRRVTEPRSASVPHDTDRADDPRRTEWLNDHDNDRRSSKRQPWRSGPDHPSLRRHGWMGSSKADPRNRNRIWQADGAHEGRQQQQDMDDDDYTDELELVLNCPSSFATPSTSRKQKCCALKKDKTQLTCLPNLVVMGAQKAGTTAIHSYLMLHPNIEPAKKKELHIFDFDRNYDAIATRFASSLPSTTEDRVVDKITLDSSPSYIADRNACPRMNLVLGRDARFVLLLRDPVERAWSDVTMKQRRIQTEEEFLNVILPKYHKELRDCFKPCMSVLDSDDDKASTSRCNVKTFRDCLPATARTHGRIVSFFKFLSMRQGDTNRFISYCLSNEERVKECISGEYRSLISREKMPRIPDVLYEEMTRLNKLMNRCCANATVTMPGALGAKAVSPQHSDSYGLGPDGHHMCIGCGCRCFPKAAMMSDISKNFLWRSLYYPQFVHCFASLDRQRILILSITELRSNPQGTLSKVFAHAGLPDSDVSQFTKEQVHALFAKQYPDFEATSGWSHVGRTDLEMPADVKAQLQEFFRPYNRKLFELLKIEPYPDWAV